jgi:hypothetical protein
LSENTKKSIETPSFIISIINQSIIMPAIFSS